MGQVVGCRGGLLGDSGGVAVGRCFSVQPENRVYVGLPCGLWRLQLAYFSFLRMSAAIQCGCLPSVDLLSVPLSVLSGANYSMGIGWVLLLFI